MARLFASISILVLIAAAVSVGAPKNASPKTPTRPIVVVFDTEKGEGADKALAASATRSLCAYLRDTQRVDAVVFNRESPTVVRAVMDKQLTADQVASYSSQEERLIVAKALAYDYASGAEVSIKDNLVQVKLWVAKTDGGKKDRWEASAQAAVGNGGVNNYDNAMQSAASASVISVARQAFMGLPVVVEASPTNGTETTAIATDPSDNSPSAPGAPDYAAQADASMKAGNLAMAIQQYQQAVNAEPANSTLRMLLVDAYARKKMYVEAHAELDRAELMGASKDQVAAKRRMIDAMQAGRTANYIEPQPNVPTPTGNTSATSTGDQAATGTPKTAVEQIVAGDKLWKASKPDDAADAYRAAIKMNPTDWRAYERLALVDASISMFSESRSAIEQLAKVQPNPSADVLSKRYVLFSAIFTQWFNSLFKQYDDDSADFAKHVISRESYYSSIKGLNGRLESMAKFLDVLPVPSDKKNAALHRSLACGLLFQGVTSLQDYLETNSTDSKSAAETFVAQAKKELETVKTLDGNKVLVQRQPQTPPAQSNSNTTNPANTTDTTAQPADQSANQGPDQSGQDQQNAPQPPPTYEQGPPGVNVQENPAPPADPPPGVGIQQGPAPPADPPPGISIQQPPPPGGEPAP